MKEHPSGSEKERPLSKYSLWIRPFVFIVHYLRFGLGEIDNALSYLTNTKKRKILANEVHRFLRLFYLKAKQEGILKESAALTYITLLGFIPFLIFVIFLIPKLPLLSGQEKLSTHLYQNLLPNSAIDVGANVSVLVTQKTTFNIVNLIVAMITSYSLFSVIRDTFDRILVMDYHPPKEFFSQLLKFFGTIIFGFVIILLLFSSSSLPILSSLLDFPMFKNLLVILLPFITQFVGLLFLYMLLPTIKVEKKALFRGTFWTTVIWVLVKSLFDYYIFHLTNIEAVYGVMKSIPVFLMWIYINWVIILGGMVLVAIMAQKEKTIDTDFNKRHYVHMTLELFTDNKKIKAIDDIVSKDMVKQIAEVLSEEDIEV